MSKTFKAFLVSYVLILLLPNISGYIAYCITIDEAKASSFKIGKSALEQGRQNVDQRLKEVISFTQQLSADADLERLIYRSDEQHNVLLMYQLAQTLTHYASTNDFLSDIYVYLKASNTIIAPGSVYVRPEHFYVSNHPSDSDYAQWLQTLADNGQNTGFAPATNYVTHDGTRRYVVFTQPLPIGSVNSVSGTVVIEIDEDKILNLFDVISSQFGGWTYISDSSGTIIASSGMPDSQAKAIASSPPGPDRQAIKGDTIIFSTGSPQFTSWHYVAGMPKSVILKSVYRIRTVTWLLTAATLLCGLLVSLFLAYRNSKPVQKIVESFREFIKFDDLEKGNEYDFIQGNISKILSNNKQLRSEIVRQEPILKDVFIKRLLHGEFASRTGIYAAASQANIGQPEEHGVVVLLQIRGYGNLESKEILNELFAARMLMKRAMLETTPNLMLTELEFDKLAVLIPVSPGSEQQDEDVRRALNPIRELNSGKYKLMFAAAVSSPYRSLEEVKRAFEEARQTLDYATLLDSDGVFWYQDLPEDSEMYYYPLELELRFQNAVRVGDEREAEAILNDLFRENFEKRELSVENHNLLIADLKASLIKAFDFRGVADSGQLKQITGAISQLQANSGTEQLKSMMLQNVKTFCGLIGVKKSDTESKLINAIIDCLQANLSDPSLSMNRIADEIGRPEKYLAQIFKEHIGEFIYAYLEKLRMEKAQRLLTGTEEKIEAISEKCGYASPQSFRRAFKRFCGITPNEFRTTTK